MTVKVCNKCHQEKDLQDFCKGKEYKDGRRNVCKRCHTNYMINYYKNNPEKTAEKNRMNTKFVPSWKRHHITEDVFNSMMKKYGGMCHSCKRQKATVIDHDHSCCKTNRSCGKCVRGVLCQKCNIALGLLFDDRKNIVSLLQYIDRLI